MRNIFAVLFLIIFGSVSLFGQVYQLPNSGFEAWDGNGSDDEPTYWNGFPSAACDLSFPASLGCGTATETRHQKSTDTRPGSTGSYSCKILATEALGIIANGNITTGQIRIGSTTATNPENYNITRTGNSSFSQEFNAKPDSIIFWSKFVCPSSSQKARMSATIHDAYDYRDPESSDANAPNHVVGKSIVNFTRGDQDWHRHSVAFDYSYPASTPEYILLTFTTNMLAGEGSTSDILYIDDVDFIYITSLNEITIDGNILSEFNPENYTYTIEAECGSAPIVEATSQSSLASITITQTDGTNPAAIEVTNGNESSTYIINFNFTHKSYIGDEICQGEPYNSNGFDLGIQAVSGTYVHEQTIYESSSCDSIIELTLTVNPTYEADTNHIMICETGEYNFYGNILIEEGIYDTIIPTIHGCDSLVTLNLTVGEYYRTYINAAICEGDTYIENGFNMNFTGIDTITYTATNGCDSLVILNLDVNPVYSSEIYDTISVGASYTDNGFEIYSTNNSGDYTYSNELESIFGCDSIIDLHLNIYLIPEDTTQTETEFGFNIYPNPASEEVMIKAEGPIDMSMEFIIYDLFGKFISRGEIINDETVVEIRDYAAGIYFIKIITEQGDSDAMKFVKF